MSGMTLSKKHLYNDEEIVIDMHPHWWFLTPRGAGLVASMILGGFALTLDSAKWWGKGLKYGSAVLVLVFLVAFLARLLQWNSINFVVTTERCIYRNGVFSKHGIEIPLDRITTVFFNQSFLERIVHAGDIAIESAGERSRQEFRDIYNPLRVQNEIYRQMEAYEDRRSGKLGAAVGAAGGGRTSVAEEIEKLDALRARGALTEAEFEAEKAKLLS